MAKMDFALKKVTGKQCPTFRLSFEQVHTPKGYQGGEEKYSITMLFPKKTDLKELKRAYTNAAKEKWGEDKAKWPKRLRSPFRDGDTDSEQPGYKGQIFIRASAKDRPSLFRANGEPLPADDNAKQVIYSGCYAKASIVAFAYDVSGNPGVSFALLGVQKVDDGERFGGARASADDFEPQADTSEDPASYGGKAGVKADDEEDYDLD